MRTHFFDEIFRPDEIPITKNELSIFAHHSKWILASGVLSIGLGVIAYAVPPVSVISLAITLASLLAINGLVQLAQVIEFRHLHGSVTRLIQAMLSIIISSLMFQYPYSGYVGVSLALSFYFLIGAVLKWVFFSETRAHGGWNWGIISAIVSFLLGLYIVAVFPFSELSTPSALLAIELVITGSGMIGWALSVQDQYRIRTHPHRDQAAIHKDQELFGPDHPTLTMRR